MTEQIPPLTIADKGLDLVGYLEKPLHGITCPQCADERGIRDKTIHQPTRIYLINVLPYNQSCQHCKRLIAMGNSLFPELFV